MAKMHSTTNCVTCLEVLRLTQPYTNSIKHHYFMNIGLVFGTAPWALSLGFASFKHLQTMATGHSPSNHTSETTRIQNHNNDTKTTNHHWSSGRHRITIHGNIINMHLGLLKNYVQYTGRTYNWLVVLNHLEKYEFVNGVGMTIPYMK